MSKNINISVDGISFHRGEFARYQSADEMVQAMKENKTYAHIFEQDGGEAALREAYAQAAPKKEVAETATQAEPSAAEATQTEPEAPRGRRSK